MGRTSGRWLDVGAGIGDLVSVAQERGWQAHGLELSETSVNFAKDVFGIEMTRQTMDEYLAANPELKGAHDMVSMVGVLEHVVDPIGLLGEAAQALAPGGHVMVQVPNANSIASMVQSVFPENVFRHMSPIEHIMLFSEASLVRAFERTGFEPIAMWFHGLDIYELLTNICLVNDRAVGSPLYERLIEMFNELQQVVDEKELSDRIICVARKV